MFHPGTAIERRGDSANSLLPSIAGGDLRLAGSADQRARYAAELALDQVLADSFPASDPPSWTLGVSRQEPHGHASPAASGDVTVPQGNDVEPVKSDVVDVSVPRRKERPLLQGLVSLAGAAGIALLVPVAILLVGLPVALAVRGIAEAVGWLLARIVG